MVTTFAPLAIFLAAVATAGLAFFTFWDAIAQWVLRFIKHFASLLDRAGIRRPAEEVFVVLVTIAAAIWVASIALLRPNPLAGAVYLLAAAALTGAGFVVFLEFQVRRRTQRFIEQLEVVLRLMASGLRSGLGLRQAINLVVDESADPARAEFARVVAQTNVGVSAYDALDTLAERMKSNDTMMMARVIRIQSQTGGDLAQILERLADTIKQRRQMTRKIGAITAESRAGALILSLLPPLMFLYLLLTQPDMGTALVNSALGHWVLVLVVILEALGVFTLMRLLKVNV